MEAKGGTPGQLGLQGLVEKWHLREEGGAAPGEEGGHNKWRVERSNDGDNWQILLMSIFGKIKMAVLLG